MEFTNRVSFGGILVKDYIWYVVLQSERFLTIYIMLWSISIIQQQFKVFMADLLTKRNCWHKNKTVYVRWKLIWPTNHQSSRDCSRNMNFFQKQPTFGNIFFLLSFFATKLFFIFISVSSVKIVHYIYLSPHIILVP